MKIQLQALGALFVSLGILGISSLCATGAPAAPKRTVAIITFNGSEPRYMITKQSMLDEVKKEGWENKVTFLYEDAKGDKAKAAEIAKSRHAEADIFVALGTSAAVPVAAEVKDKPIIIGMVYDPVHAKLINDWAHSGTNVCGSSNFVSIPLFMKRLIKRSEGTYPIKNITVLYAPGEKNSELQMKGVQSVEKELGVTVTLVPLNSFADVEKWTKALAPKSTDLVFLTGCNVIGTHIAPIMEAINKNKIWSATHLDDLVERGVFLGLVAEPHEVGKLSGKALVKVLKGENPSDQSVEYPLPKLMINKKTEQAGGFKLPPAIQQWAAGGQ